MTRTWRGVYHEGRPLAPWIEYELSATAAAELAAEGQVLSHGAAAVVSGMQVLKLDGDWATIDFTADGTKGGCRKGRRRLHRRRLDAEDVTIVNGIARTSIARTALDLALAGTFEQAICALDAALRMEVGRAGLESAMLRLGRRDGITRLRAALPHASGLSESVGESWSRALMLRWPEIPEPVLQFEFLGECGEVIFRPDFLWSHRVVGEFDGDAKLRNGDTPERRVARDNAITERGLWPTHWRWSECAEPDRLRHRLRSALGPHGLLLR